MMADILVSGTGYMVIGLSKVRFFMGRSGEGTVIGLSKVRLGTGCMVTGLSKVRFFIVTEYGH